MKDGGCNTNLISKHLVQSLASEEKKRVSRTYLMVAGSKKGSEELSVEFFQDCLLTMQGQTYVSNWGHKGSSL